MVAGGASEFGSAANFTAQLKACDVGMRLSRDRKSLQASWGGTQLDFYPNNQVCLPALACEPVIVPCCVIL